MRLLRAFAVLLACVGLILPRSLGAQTIEFDGTRSTVDVVLSAKGQLHGQVIDSQGHPVDEALVGLRSHGRQVAVATTGTDGRFAVCELRGGLYEVATEHGNTTVRIWAPSTAPPAAQQILMVVSGPNVVRGAFSCCSCVRALANPWVLALIATAAIAIPLALDDDDDEPASL